LMVKL